MYSDKSNNLILNKTKRVGWMNKLLIAIVFAIAMGTDAKAENESIESQCNYSGTDINISLKIDLNNKKISLSGLKNCEITSIDEFKVLGRCSPPTYSSLDFIPEYVNKTGVGRWSMKVSDKYVVDAKGNIVYFEYLCKKGLLANE